MKRPVKKYCLLRDNETLKLAVRTQMKRYNVSELCKEMGIVRICLYEWLNGADPRSMYQYDIIRFCKRIGIVIDLKITYTINDVE